MPIKITLDDTIKRDKDKLTKNKIAVRAQIRPGTISDLTNGKSKGITFETVEKMLDAMNEINPDGNYGITDIFKYVNEKKDGGQ